MSLTGYDLRKRLRRAVVRGLDALLERLEREDVPPAAASTPAPAAAAPPPAVEPPRAAKPRKAAAEKATAAPLRPLPEVGARPLGAQRTADVIAEEPAPAPARAEPIAPLRAEPTAPVRGEPTAPVRGEPIAPLRGETAAAKKAKASPEDRQKAHWDRTRRGILRFVADHGGTAGLRELHDHSEKTYFVAHVGFSRLMEELTGEGLLDYDHDTAVATLTDAGKAASGA